jgi:hypothetical protein
MAEWAKQRNRLPGMTAGYLMCRDAADLMHRYSRVRNLFG